MANEGTRFTFQGENGRDEFRREQIADKVISLLTSDIDISPMVIDGNWGTGKTEFCHKLIRKFEAEHKNFRLLYIDAFQADHADNPLLTILAEVLSLLPDSEQKQSLREKIIPVVRYGIKTTLKAGVSHLLRENVDKIGEDLDQYLQEAADKAIDASVMAMLKDHEEAQKNLKALQSVLAEIAENHPILIFVDELDRCRPNFAVQMLEVIKHTFHVENVKFVLITNTAQLRAAINHSYGPDVDAQRYLDKFLKFRFYLPDFIPGIGRTKTLTSIKHFNDLVEKSLALKNTVLNSHTHATYTFSATLISQNQLSLREVETFVRHLEIFQRINDGISNGIPLGYQLLNVFGVFIFCFRPDILVEIKSRNVNAYLIANVLGLKNMDTFQSKSSRPSSNEVIAVLLAQSCTLNNEKYAFSEEMKERWQESIAQHFFDFDNVHGKEFSFVEEVFDVLNLTEGRL